MYRVLLVEDEEIELETLRDYIDWKKNGISRVFTARNGRRALECLEENMADIVITDIQMPGMSGIELAETIVRRGYPCKIVFLTGYDDFSYIHSAFQVNAVDYLLKPFTIEEVEACLKKVRSELEKSEIADWSRKTAAKQLLEMALREKQETELLRKNFRGVFGEELEECRFGIIAVYGKTEENICSKIQEKYKGIRYISKTERISILLLAGYLSVKDTAFQIWNDYLLASLYVSKKELKTLTVAIQSLFSAQSSDYTTAMAAIVISVLPIAILFLSLQKYFIKGMTVGAVKG
mgnify:CR=1 FL=1